MGRRLSELRAAYFPCTGTDAASGICPWIGKEKLSVSILGLGDVGRNVAVGLRTLGEGRIGRIGIYDLNEALTARMEMELNQIGRAAGDGELPEAVILGREQLFDGDVFLYCATRGVPPVGTQETDVRMAQYEANREILSVYARQAADCGFKGLFGVVSDPVDLLCGAAFKAAGEGEHPLHPEQIQGFGLGVMYARARYFANKDERFRFFASEGRVYGPHGQGLVAANSIYSAHYDDALTEELTELAVTANRRIRELSFKPYIAPAYSSAVYSVLASTEGKWTDSARWLNGVFFGARSRVTENGTVFENPDLPEALFRRIEASYRRLEEMQ